MTDEQQPTPGFESIEEVRVEDFETVDGDRIATDLYFKFDNNRPTPLQRVNTVHPKDAYLISAAPDLRDALEEVLLTHHEGYRNQTEKEPMGGKKEALKWAMDALEAAGLTESTDSDARPDSDESGKVEP